ncbi:MAG TPA: hypothetical protein VI815_03060 [Candidatus Nanoarchaeia archaeon]|nr:hypothetical protein [Candidatus Nanoarchaeia archaeon]
MKIKDIFTTAKESTKLLIIALIISSIGRFYINTFLVPDQKAYADEISKIENQISSHYDAKTRSYDNMHIVNSLQKKVINLQYDVQKTILVEVSLTSLILLTIASILAWWTQYIFTDINFKTETKLHTVLAAALIGSIFIVGLVYYVKTSY